MGYEIILKSFENLFFFAGSQAVLVYVTMHGTIVGWDLRAYGNAWKIENKSKQGKFHLSVVVCNR